MTYSDLQSLPALQVQSSSLNTPYPPPAPPHTRGTLATDPFKIVTSSHPHTQRPATYRAQHPLLPHTPHMSSSVSRPPTPCAPYNHPYPATLPAVHYQHQLPTNARRPQGDYQVPLAPYPLHAYPHAQSRPPTPRNIPTLQPPTPSLSVWPSYPQLSPPPVNTMIQTTAIAQHAMSNRRMPHQPLPPSYQSYFPLSPHPPPALQLNIITPTRPPPRPQPSSSIPDLPYTPTHIPSHYP